MRLHDRQLDAHKREPRNEQKSSSEHRRDQRFDVESRFARRLLRGGSQPDASDSDVSDELDVKIYTSTPPPQTPDMAKRRSLVLEHQVHKSTYSISPQPTTYAEERQPLKGSQGCEGFCSADFEKQQTVDDSVAEPAINKHSINNGLALSALFWSERQKKYHS